jgi:hypothetical protein
VIGSVFTSLYASRLVHSDAGHLPGALLHLAQSSVGAGYAVASHAPAALHAPLALSVQTAFMSGLHAGCLVAAGTCLAGALGALALPGSRLSAPAADTVVVRPDPGPVAT